MRIPRAVYISIFSGVIGLLIGGFGVSYFWARTMNTLVRVTPQADAVMTVHNLKMLRQGKPQYALDMMETTLDSNIISLGANLKLFPAFSAETNKAISTVATYRKEYPFSSQTPELKIEIDRILASKN